MADKIRYWIWVYSSYFPWKLNINSKERLTVILPYFSRERIKHARYMVRLLLRCDFIDQIIATNHNPVLDIFEWIDIKDTRVKLINNNVTKRGPGFRWFIANTLDSEYFLIIDDDFLIFPKQLAILFTHLIEEPGIPHGLSGRQSIDGRFHARENMQVEVLHQIYAVTRDHIKKYREIADAVRLYQPDIYPLIEEISDDIVISMTGKNKPRIHDVGYNLRCHTAKTIGISLHQEESFWEKRLALKKVLDTIQALSK